MTVECPQCKATLPRSESRFCNQCGAELRPVPASLQEKAEKPVEAPPKVPVMEDLITDQMEAPLTPVPSGNAILRIVPRDGGVIERELDKNETKIGKGALNDVVLVDPAVSTSHALITRHENGYTVTDLGSRNGTLVNESRLTEVRKLNHGDVIKMGRCSLTFRFGQGSETVMLTHSPVAAVTTQTVTEDALAAAVIAEGLAKPADVQTLRGAGAKGRRLFRALIEEAKLSDIKLRDLMSSKFGIPVGDVNSLSADQGVVSALTPGLLRDHLILPVTGRPDQLTVIVADPTDEALLERVKRAARRPVELRLAAASELATKLDLLFAPRLIGVLPTGEKVEALITRQEIEIGKAAHNQIILSQPTVSNTHAVILARNGGYTIVDLGSSNGTFVNGERLGDQAHTLQHGDKVQIAEVVLTFRNPAETTESKTARLSPELLEEIRRRAGLGLPIAAAAGSNPVAAANPDEKAEKKQKKKKGDDDRLKAAFINSMSRLVATVVGSILTVLTTIYLLRPGGPLSGSGGAGGGGGAERVVKSKLAATGSFFPFSGGLFEASGVTWIEDTNTVLVVDDGKPNELLLMTLDSSGRQSGALVPIPQPGPIIDPEAITYDGTWFYLVGSQSDPKNGPRNSLVRFAYDRQTRTIRGTPEVIGDLRAFLLNLLPELRFEGGDKPGTKGGLNIEGMTWDPINSRLLLGLRSPLINNRAVIIPLKLKDPLGPFTSANLQISTPRMIQLGLGGQGIRDLDYNARLKSFLIISGATELAEKTDFGLWEWNGDADQSKPDAHLRQERTLDERSKPEGITNVTINGKSYLFVVGDASRYLKLDYVEGQ